MSLITLTITLDSKADADLASAILNAVAGNPQVHVDPEPAAVTTKPKPTEIQKEIAKDLKVIKEVPPAPDSVWDRGSWVNLRSTGFRKHVEANLDTFMEVDEATRTAVIMKWATLYKDEQFPNPPGIEDPAPTPESEPDDPTGESGGPGDPGTTEAPAPEPDATEEPAGEAKEQTVGTLMGGDQKTDDTSLPEGSTKENTESLFGQ